MNVQIARKAPIGIQRRMLELGVIRFGDTVGGKGSRPRALQKFRLTSASRQILEAAAEIYGTVKPVREWSDAPNPGQFEVYLDTNELPVILPPVFSSDDGSPTYPYSQAWELWSGATCERRCDGELCTVPKGAGLAEVACLCDPDDRACEIVTRISMMLPDLPGIGLWRLNTQGKYAAAELPGTLQLLSLAAAQNTYLRCTLRLEARSRKSRNADGKPETHRFVVPILDPGITPGALLSLTTPDELTRPPILTNVPRIPERPALPAGPPPGEQSLEKPEAAAIGESAPLPLQTGIEISDEQNGEPAPVSAPVEGDAWMRAVHAAGRERGLDHEALRRIAADLFEWDPDSPHSLTDLTPAQRGALRKAVNARPLIESGTGSSGGDPVSESVPAPAPLLPPAGSESAPQPDAPSAFEIKLWETAAAHGIHGWDEIDGVARTVFRGGDPEAFLMGGPEWETVLGEIAEGLHDG